MGHLGPLLGHLGALLGPFGRLLGPPGRPKDSPWRPLVGPRAALGALLAPLGGHLGPSWGRCEPVQVYLVLLWAIFGAPGRPLSSNLDNFCSLYHFRLILSSFAGHFVGVVKGKRLGRPGTSQGDLISRQLHNWLPLRGLNPR